MVFPFDKKTDTVSEPTAVYIDKPYQLSIVVFSLDYQLGCYEC